MNLTRSLLILLAATGTAVAQPPKNEPSRDQPRDAQRDPQKDNDPAAMKARLERWLEETKHREAIITAALKKLSEGASPEDVRKSMEPGTRPQRGSNGGGSGGGPGGRDGWDRSRGPGGPPRDGKADGDQRPPLDREQVLAFIEKQNPEMATRMRAMMKESPEVADRILSRLTPQISEIMAERDDQLREIRTSQLKNGWEVMGVVRDIREATKANDTAVRSKSIERMRTLLGTGFDLRLRLHEREAAVLEERLAKLKQELVEERTGREAFIADRLKMATEARERREPKSEGKSEGKPDAKPDQKH